jgi:predicted nucleic acid-binding protein
MDWQTLLTGRHITDAYLLALAVKNGGRFVTLDRVVPLHAVKQAGQEHLFVIEAAAP